MEGVKMNEPYRVLKGVHHGIEEKEEREYSEETILAYEIKNFLEEMRPEMEFIQKEMLK